ncbi:MAG: hypothetical protein H0W61_15215 [Bacteroidetes bacterium]|nr:hypothetical protein [Bacteroidota bacterium]
MNEVSKLFFTKKGLYFIVLFVLLLTLFFIHKNKHADWGDDYIQYIYQAHHLFDAENYKTLVNPDDHGPVKRGVLFSVLLSINNSSDDIITYKNIICLTYISAGLLAFLFLSQHFPSLPSLLATLFVFYNYRNLWLKNEIVPEYLFMFFLYLATVVIYSRKKYSTIVISLIFACLISTRAIGFVFYFAYLIYEWIDPEKIRETSQRNRSLLKSIFWLALFLISVNSLVPLHTPFDLSFYKGAFSDIRLSSIYSNVFFYIKNIGYFFEQEIPGYMNPFIIYPMLIIGLIGLGFRLFKRPSFIEFGFVIYMLALLFWPHQGAGNRFLIPVLPIILYFILNGFYFIFSVLKIASSRRDLLMTVGLFILIATNVNTVLLLKDHSVETGPLSDILKNDFTYIQKNTRTSDVIAFCKPYVINYKCDRNSFALNSNTNNAGLMHADYFLIARDPLLNEAYNEGLKTTVLSGDTVTLEHFYLIKLKK